MTAAKTVVIFFIDNICKLLLQEQVLELFCYRILNLTNGNSGQALIWKSGTDKLCYWFNKVWLDFAGKTLDQEKGMGWTKGVHPDDLERCIDIYTTAFDQRLSFSMDYRLMHAVGTYRWIQDDGCPTYDLEGVFIGYIGHCLDVTNRKSLESKLVFNNNELESERERIAVTLQSIGDGVITTDIKCQWRNDFVGKWRYTLYDFAFK